MKDNEVFSISNIPFLISINLLNKDDYRKYINKITYKTVEIDPDIAKFGGQVEGITIPKETHNLDIIEVLEGDKIEYVTIKIISFEEYEEKSNFGKKYKLFLKKYWLYITIFIALLIFIAFPLASIIIIVLIVLAILKF